MRRQGNLGIHTECILTEVGVQGVGLWDGVTGEEVWEKRRSGEAGDEGLECLAEEMGSSQGGPWGPME